MKDKKEPETTKENAPKTAKKEVKAEPKKEKPKTTKESKPITKEEKKDNKEKTISTIKGEWGIIQFPHLSEKSIANVETQNKIVFIVKQGAKRSEIKKAVENMFDVKVKKINILTTSKGLKKAYVRLHPQYSALDIATRLGMM
ncbi:MAG: 50S ribosomal protein L23 [archaeon]